ncbi:MAG: hypothetical protein ACXVNM_06835 [Bacteroidia bacterium]
MEEYNYAKPPSSNKGQNKGVKIVNIVNGCVLAVMLLLCLIDGGGILSFFVGALMSLYNLISMIIYITQKNVMAYVSNIIWMLLMPIIGFGCCAAAFKGGF